MTYCDEDFVFFVGVFSFRNVRVCARGEADAAVRAIQLHVRHRSDGESGYVPARRWCMPDVAASPPSLTQLTGVAAGTARAVDADAVNTPAPDAVDAAIVTEVAAASAEYDAERKWLKANANAPGKP